MNDHSLNKEEAKKILSEFKTQTSTIYKYVKLEEPIKVFVVMQMDGKKGLIIESGLNGPQILVGIQDKYSVGGVIMNGQIAYRYVPKENKYFEVRDGDFLSNLLTMVNKLESSFPRKEQEGQNPKIEIVTANNEPIFAV